MSVSKLEDLLNISDSDLKHISGNIASAIHFVSTPENLKKGSLVFVSSNEQWAKALEGGASAIIALEKILPADVPKSVSVFTTKNIKLTMTQILPLFDKSSKKFHKGIHQTAVVSTQASIGKNVNIGAHCFIGKNVKIADGVNIGPGSVIEDDVTIGEGTTLHAQVFVGHSCIIGNHCDIQAHTTIGSDGFGFYTDSQYKHYKVPQIGNVVIGDRVEMGASCCIDRATIDSTIIGAGSKLDNLCHIAHNCTVGENSLIAAGFFVAGSTHLGKRFTTGGNSVVSTQLNVADGVTLAGRSTVTNDISEGGQYGGYPLQPLKDALRTISTIGNIVDMRKKIALILKTLSIKE
tara:strand:+ start:54355 stop:55401 length:1047 start_codon:yes stop_codon:yes gene_type:complete